MSTPNYLVGLDVGSTTVKAVVVDDASDRIVWSDYQRHETKQPEKTLEFLKRMEGDVSLHHDNCRIFMTGSGGGALAALVGGKFVQEVTAVSLAVEKLHPEVNSVVELGGQDAKIIVFKEDPESGRKKKIPSMNDKCAGGTGAVIDKINAKLRIPVDELGDQGYLGVKLHKVAGKCGVFAETDINGLHGVALRRDRPAESDGPDARAHATPPCPAAWRAEHLHSRHARGVAAQHPEVVEGARRPDPRR